MELVRAKGLAKSYDTVEALRGVDLSVREGEIFGVLGPNGAGKTTLMEILATMRRPSAGDAWIAEHSVVREPELVRRNLGVVFQVGTLDQVMTAEENLRIHGRLYKVPKAELDARIPQLLAIADLTDRADDRVSTFSGGMKRRLEIVRSILHHPRVLLLDEPTVALDPQSRRLLWERIRRLRDELRMTVLVTTHYMEEADSLCDRLVIVDGGRIVAEDTPANLKARLGGDRLEIRLSGAPDRLVERIRGVPDVARVEVEGTRLVVVLRAPATTIPQVMHAVAEEGERVVALEHRPSSMDDVFLSQTGKAPRDRKKRRRRFEWSEIFGG